ncbi:hypothetical protein OAC51_09780 [Flavobacteriaceae bacterium]|nr:hypothetical protein [Flavobacteriaceae bacterium]
MSITVTWMAYAKISYYEEIDFIDKKWTIKEVQDFIFLVEDFILTNQLIEWKLLTISWRFSRSSWRYFSVEEM